MCLERVAFSSSGIETEDQGLFHHCSMWLLTYYAIATRPDAEGTSNFLCKTIF